MKGLFTFLCPIGARGLRTLSVKSMSQPLRTGMKNDVIDTDTDAKSMNWPTAFLLFLYFADNLYCDCNYDMECHLIRCPRYVGGSLVVPVHHRFQLLALVSFFLCLPANSQY